MPRQTKKPTLETLKKLLSEQNSDDDTLRALLHGILEKVALPADGFVVGESTKVVAIQYNGNPRCGLTARCERFANEYVVNLADVVFTSGSVEAALVDLYRSWLNLEPLPAASAQPSLGRHKVNTEEIDLGQPLELVVLACKSSALRCRVPGTERELTLRTGVRDEVPGEVITVLPTRKWTHARHPYLSGKVQASRLDASALALTPLELRPEGDWDPDDEYWGEEGEPIDEWAKPIITRGIRPAFELEQVIPGIDPDGLDIDTDPIIEASELHAARHKKEAHDLLMGLLAQDLRCLDAHAHLGNFAFDWRPAVALRHYAVGVAIGELSLGKGFEGVLPWGLIDNRPFLRCLHGVGLSLWKLGKPTEATEVFRRILWLNPSDYQGARFNLVAAEARITWEEAEAAEAR